MDKIITIAREYGSGGREIGIKLAKKLGYKFYDKELISLAADNEGLASDFIASHEEQAPSLINGGFGDVSFASFIYVPSYSDQIFFRQCDVLRQIADKGPCVIVGRCSDYVLREYDTVNCFIYSDIEAKIKRKRGIAREKKNYTDREMEKSIMTINKGRRKYYEHYTGSRWGDPENFDLCINTTNGQTDAAVEAIASYIASLK